MEFIDWFPDRMAEIGYKNTITYTNADHAGLTFGELSESFHVVYIKQAIEPELIRMIFDNHHLESVLFVVAKGLLPQGVFGNDPPLWVRALHAIYYGRVYTWNGINISAIHYDWTNGKNIFSETIEPDAILFTDTDCKLRDFPGVFHIARFYDKAFWKETQQQAPPKQERTRQQRKQAHPPPSAEDVYEAFKRKFQEHMRSHGYSYDNGAYVPPTYRPTGDKWTTLFMGLSTREDVRKQYKALARQYHPDLNPGIDDSEMKAINIAYEKVMEYLK